MGRNPWSGTPAGSPPRVMGRNQISGRHLSLQSTVVHGQQTALHPPGRLESIPAVTGQDRTHPDSP